MKKIIYLLSLIALFSSLYGCGNNSNLIMVPFECDVEIISGEDTVKGMLVFENESNMYIDFASDEVIGGLNVTYNGEVYSYICDGVETIAPVYGGDVPLYGLFAAMELLASSDVEITSDNNTFVLSDGNSEYTYIVDGEKGMIMQIDSSYGKIIFTYKY